MNVDDPPNEDDPLNDETQDRKGVLLLIDESKLETRGQIEEIVKETTDGEVTIEGEEMRDEAVMTDEEAMTEGIVEIGENEATLEKDPLLIIGEDSSRSGKIRTKKTMEILNGVNAMLKKSRKKHQLRKKHQTLDCQGNLQRRRTK